MAFGSNTVMKARWNDGNQITEVQIPLLATGQRVVVEHSKTPAAAKTIPQSALVPPPPIQGDTPLDEAYRKRGLKVNPDAPAVSISKSRQNMNNALKTGNYALALQWNQLVLTRYPSHPEFLRAKASILLLMGEKEMAIETYEAVEEIESDPAVRKKLEELQKQN